MTQATSPTRPPFRADHVGSLLRPPRLLAQRQAAQRGELSFDALRKLEDECIREVVAMQEGLGLQAVTDGEYRRGSFHGEFISKVHGVEFKQRAATPGGGAPFVAVVSKRLQRPAAGIEVENFRFLNSIAKATAKQTVPSPTMMHFRGGREAIDRTAYPDIEDFFADLARVYRDFVRRLDACVTSILCR